MRKAGLAAIALLLALSSGAVAAPAAAAPAAAAPAVAGPSVAASDDRPGAAGAGTVSIGVSITPRDLCAGIRPPCKCTDGAPTLPPGLAKKAGKSDPAEKPGPTKKPGKPKPDWCGSPVAPSE
ncbi:hypothetical protein MUN74_06510 [Agromyces endophyticus]|uniref:hypothetical protein n=1 Tax=Agromyces sp. H17E-10 TaxID=2932244 RepID=UPI001FCFBD5F|nr:hypothetical protein [Agromyces sp. H17E-10]UOQ90561.1 hypothetical protein MUN74_06510 [Agromyces sp. H17E-10]